MSTVPDPQPGSAPEEKGAGATVAARISDQLAVGVSAHPHGSIA